MPEVRIAFVSPVFRANSTIDEFWDYGICQINQARALVALGHDVTVISRFPEARVTERDGVKYCFVKDTYPEMLGSRQLSKPVLRQLKEVDPEIVHFHGLGYPVFILGILRSVSKPTQVFVEYHGGEPSRFPMRFLQYLALRSATGLIFTNTEKADAWRVGLGLGRDRFHYAVECAPDRVMEDRTAARERTGFSGSPVVLWNSRAIGRRNPVVVIEMYERFLQNTHGAECHFYMMVPDYDTDLLQKMIAMSTRSAELRKHFTLIVGRKPQAEMTDYYNSADYIVSGSEDDPYGYGVVDAMSCGVIPIVTKSGTFLDITNAGEIGLLWDLSDPSTLADAFNKMLSDTADIARMSREVQHSFCKRLSMDAQGNYLDQIYRGALVESM